GSDVSKPAIAPPGSDVSKPAIAPPGSGVPNPAIAPTGLDLADPQDLSRLLPPPLLRAGPSSRCEPHRAVIAAKLEAGLSAQRIYQDLVAEHAFTGSYYSVRRMVRRLSGPASVPFRRMECAPGQEAQVDFGTGAPIIIPDKEVLPAGVKLRRRRTHVFRIVLSHSRKAYSEAVYRQTTEEFIRCLENAFRHFGGVPRTLVIDNLVAAHLDGTALDIKVHSDDGTTDVAPVDSTIDAVDDTFFELWIDCRNPADVQVYVNGVDAVPAGTTLTLAAATNALKAIAHMEKTNDDTVADLRIHEQRNPWVCMSCLIRCRQNTFRIANRSWDRRTLEFSLNDFVYRFLNEWVFLPSLKLL
ncbi:MAG: DDE-type integrase/transposase/recombinase, partial [Phycisphaerae bacterium]|nr:DDE-type integrase/transposase/recombinase [Phycisphaerae bacterium]